jgi:all-trans-retinol dehydrogenase (NAD+)
MIDEGCGVDSGRRCRHFFTLAESSSMKTFRGKTALISGAAGGMGRLLALALAERGANVVVVDLRLDSVRAVAQEVAARGRRGFAHALDISDPEAVLALKRSVEMEVGPVDILVNNAGVVHGGRFDEVPVERHLRTYRVNVEGLVLLTHAFFPHLLRSKEAHLVNVASASGFIGLPNGSTYASSKWAVIGFSESIRLELKQRGARHVGVTTVCPSYVSTGMFDGVRAPLLVPVLRPERVVAKIMRSIERGDTFVREPFAVKTLEFLRGVLPRNVFDFGTELLGVSSSMTSWKGHASIFDRAPSNTNGEPQLAMGPQLKRRPA